MIPNKNGSSDSTVANKPSADQTAVALAVRGKPRLTENPHPVARHVQVIHLSQNQDVPFLSVYVAVKLALGLFADEVVPANVIHQGFADGRQGGVAERGFAWEFCSVEVRSSYETVSQLMR